MNRDSRDRDRRFDDRNRDRRPRFDDRDGRDRGRRFDDRDSRDNDRRFESVFSKKVRAGKRRTYFFDVRRTKGDDFYLTLTESTKKFHGNNYERHKIFLYKEDFNRFLGNLEEVINYIKTELMPDFDYEEFDRRQEEWEARHAEGFEGEDRDEHDDRDRDDEDDRLPENGEDREEAEMEERPASKRKDDHDDMSW